MSDSITRDIVIKASPETVYDVVSTPEHIAHWFSDDADLVPVAGARGVLTFHVDERRTTPATVEIVIVSADRPHLFAFRWVSPERQRASADATERFSSSSGSPPRAKAPALPSASRGSTRSTGTTPLRPSTHPDTTRAGRAS